jgi:hypothetical protein
MATNRFPGSTRRPFLSRLLRIPSETRHQPVMHRLFAVTGALIVGILVLLGCGDDSGDDDQGTDFIDDDNNNDDNDNDNNDDNNDDTGEMPNY